MICAASTSPAQTCSNPPCIDLSTQVRGVLSPSNGGTGSTSGSTSRFNGQFIVDGNTYASLGAAWNAAAAAANATGQNQVVQLGVGTYNVSSTLTEPSNGACVSVLGTASPTQQANSGVPATTINVTASIGDLFFLGNAAQAQGCTFRNLNILGNKNITHAFELQYFRGLSFENVAVNDTTDTGILLGEASGGHQSFFDMRNVTVSYSASSFTPASRPNYGVQLQPTTIDSNIDTLYVRNAQTAALYNQGAGIHTAHLHGFGYPYTCTTAPCNNHETNAGAADASYASDFVVVDTGGAGNTYLDSYLDSPAKAAFNLSKNGVVITSGYLEWPDTTSFPNANLAWVQSSFTSNLVINNIGCLNMNPTQAGAPSSPAGASGVWISYFASQGLPPSLSSVSDLAGCGDFYQTRNNSRQTVFDVNGNNSSNTNLGPNHGVTPKVLAFPLASQADEGNYESECFSGADSATGDIYYGGPTGAQSTFAVRCNGTLHLAGGLQTSAVSVTANTTLAYWNKNVMANASSGAITLTLPSCFTPMPDGLTPTGMEITVYKTESSANPVTLATTSGQTINYQGTNYTSGSLSLTTSRYALTLVCGSDSNWYAR
jgi:hypothetical protein